MLFLYTNGDRITEYKELDFEKFFSLLNKTKVLNETKNSIK